MRGLLRIKRIVLCTLLALFAVCVFAACGEKEEAPPATTYYTVSFYSEDGLEKYKELQFAEGESIVYDGTPTKAATQEYTYVFAGWATEVGGAVEQSLVADKAMSLYAVFTAQPVEKTQVAKPAADTTQFTYNGEVQQYTIAPSEEYEVSGAWQTDAGEYEVRVSLKDPVGSTWEDGTTQPLVYPFVIAQAQNSWTVQPAMEGYQAVDAPGGASTPVGTAAFGSVVFAYSNAREGTYTEQLPDEAGDYFMKATVEGNANYTGLSEIVSFQVTAKLVEKPAADPTQFTYNGEAQQYTVAPSEDYTVSGTSQTDAGEHEVRITLTDTKKYAWEDGTTQPLVYSFVIAQAQNSWTVQPAIEGWRVEDAPEGVSTPVGTAAFGSVVFTYSNAREGTYTEQIPNEVGDYFMKATVEENANYTGLSEIVSFRLTTDLVFQYTITFYDSDGTLLDKQVLEEGSAVTYAGKQLGTAGENTERAFLGWTDGETEYAGELPQATKNVAYHAMYEDRFLPAKGTEEAPYLLTSADELIFLSEEVLEGEDFTGKYFTLANDIDLTGSAFQPIGDDTHPFCGNFDFANKTVTYEATAALAGLFGNNAGTIENLVAVVTVETTGVAGGVAARNGGVIRACTVSGSVKGATAGGIAGINAGTIEYVRSSALVYKQDALAMSELVGGGAGIYVGSTSEGHVLTLAQSVWDGAAAAAFEGGDGTQQTPYLIKTAQQLAYLAESNAQNAYYKDVYFRLEADLDLGGRDWQGIGGGSSTNAFAGHFDGNGHVIYGLLLESGSSRRGLFNSAIGSISNLTVVGKATAGTQYVGLLVGINYSALTDCKAYGHIDLPQATNVGLITGCQGGKDVTNCAAYGFVSAKRMVGGVVGYNYKFGGAIATLSQCTNYATVVATELLAASQNNTGVGGVVGVTGAGATIAGCVNYGAVTSAQNVDGGVGGIVGQLFAATVENCKNYGTIDGVRATGGIAGYTRTDSSILRCENFGQVRASYGAGGIAGENRGDIAGSTNRGAISVSEEGAGYWLGGIVGMSGASGSVVSCENYGVVTGIGTSTGGVGGIVGSAYGLVNKCKNHADVFGNAYLGGIVGSVLGASGEVRENENHGNISTALAEGSVNLGGIVGYQKVGTAIGNHNYGTYVLPEGATCSQYGYLVGYDEVGESGVYDNVNHYAAE